MGVGITEEHRDLEKDHGTKAKSNNKLYPHVLPGQNRTVGIVGNGRRQALSRPTPFLRPQECVYYIDCIE